MSAETAAVLDRAADIVGRNGLHKGSFCAMGPDLPKMLSNRACCARGAINLAANGDNPQQISDVGEEAHTALCAYLGIADEEDGSVADWNDDENTTAEQVIAALRGAAQAEREAAS